MHWLYRIPFNSFKHRLQGDVVVILKLILQNSSLGTRWELSLKWTQENRNDKSALVQVMAWCHQAIIHYLSQSWPRCMSSFGATMPQCVKCRSHVIHWKQNRWSIWQLLRHWWHCKLSLWQQMYQIDDLLFFKVYLYIWELNLILTVFVDAPAHGC